MRAERLDDDLDSSPSDPLADLLFTLIAAVLPAILLLAPLTETIGRTAQVRQAARHAARATLRGRPIRSIVAMAEGLQIGGPAGRYIRLDSIGDDPGLAATLDDMRKSSEPLLLLVEPDGLESAFLFDPVAAAHGPTPFDEVRLTAPCAGAKEVPLRVLCGGAS